jgi:fatty acid synthase
VWGNLRNRAGAIGLGRCMRLEPRGDYVRFILDMVHLSSLTATAAAAKPAVTALDGDDMVELASSLDLVSNVFKDGRHGTIVTTTIKVGGVLVS